MSQTLLFLGGSGLNLAVLRSLLLKTDLSLLTKRLLKLERVPAGPRMIAAGRPLTEESRGKPVLADSSPNDYMKPAIAEVSANRSADLACDGHIPVNTYKPLLYVLPVHSAWDSHGAGAGAATLAGRLTIIVWWEEKLLGSG